MVKNGGGEIWSRNENKREGSKERINKGVRAIRSHVGLQERRRLENKDFELGDHVVREYQTWPWAGFTGSLVKLEIALLYQRLAELEPLWVGPRNVCLTNFLRRCF